MSSGTQVPGVIKQHALRLRLGREAQILNLSAVLEWDILASWLFLLLSSPLCCFSFLFERCVIFASRVKLWASPFPLLSLCIMSNVVRVHHYQLDALLTLTLQTSVAGHRHLRGAAKKGIPKRDLGLRASA